MNLLNIFFYSKQNDLIEFKDILEMFYFDTEEVKPNNETQGKDLEKLNDIKVWVFFEKNIEQTTLVPS